MLNLLLESFGSLHNLHYPTEGTVRNALNEVGNANCIGIRGSPKACLGGGGGAGQGGAGRGREW